MLPIQSAVRLAPFTTFRIGGPADFFVEVGTLSQLIEALEYGAQNELPAFIFSGGSNLLIADCGIRGLVIRVASTSARVSGDMIRADAGIQLLEVVKLASKHGLAGLERLAGIPGSLGGALRGNAGAFGMEIGQTLKRVKVYDRRAAKIQEFSQADCIFGYRTSYFKTHPECIILSAEFALRPGDTHELEAINQKTMAEREAKHSQAARCAGSFFMNPVVADQTLQTEFAQDTGMTARGGKLPAGWLIDQVGLRGKKIGDAQVSPQHPNYLINTGAATAEDVVMLSSLVKQRVRTELGVQLKEEVQLVGF